MPGPRESVGEPIIPQVGGLPLIRIQMEDLSRSFDGFSLCFISRNYNKLAHACARLVFRNSEVVEWPITPPDVIDIITSDCNSDHD